MNGRPQRTELCSLFSNAVVGGTNSSTSVLWPLSMRTPTLTITIHLEETFLEHPQRGLFIRLEQKVKDIQYTIHTQVAASRCPRGTIL